MRRLVLLAVLAAGPGTGCARRAAEAPSPEPAQAVAVVPALVAEPPAAAVRVELPAAVVAAAAAPMPREAAVRVTTGASETLPRPPGAVLAPAPRVVVADRSAVAPPVPRAKVEQPAPPVVVRPVPDVEPDPAPRAEPLGSVNSAVGARDLEDVRIFIDGASAGGRMPSPDLTRTALLAAGSPAWRLVERKAIVLTGAADREGVWAYEAAARERGGLVAGPNGVETLTAAELARRLPPGK